MSLNDALAKAAENLTRRMAETMTRMIAATERPQQLEIFQLPPVGVWVYVVEYRDWLKYLDRGEDWSEWLRAEKQGLVKRWYSRKHDAELAMTRHKLRTRWLWGDCRNREYRIREEWHEKRPWRRDLKSTT